MKRLARLWFGVFVTLWVGFPAAASEIWDGYLDFAYVYSSADSLTLQSRLDKYGSQAGIKLEDYITEELDPGSAGHVQLGETGRRRLAIAQLLSYLDSDDPLRLSAAVEIVEGLADRLARHENRYWYHYIRAHRALQLSDTRAFNREVFELWFQVIVPLEATYDTHQALSLDRTNRAGFVSALPYLYENIGRLVLLRSQRFGLQQGLDPLAAVVRFLVDNRIGAHPEIVPPESSFREFVEQIVTRLDGPESDGGSLTFTLALYQASNRHNEASGLLAGQGLTPATQESIRVAIGAYQTALRRADTLQGQTVVYTRALRQLGELYAAKRRLGVDPEIEVPFSIDRAIDLYSELDSHRVVGWERQGYRDHGRGEYLAAMKRLWEEIQEASFNAAEYYLSKWDGQGRTQDAHLKVAIRHYAQYLALFDRFAAAEASEAIPESAFFSAYWASRGIGDAVLNSSSGSPSLAQLAHATERYQGALKIFPFETRVWSSLALALERQGREDDFLPITQPIAEAVERSSALDGWIQEGREAFSFLDAMRSALADDLAIMYLGFAGVESLPELEQGLSELLAKTEEFGERRSALETRLAGLGTQRREWLAAESEADAALPMVSAPPVSGAPSAIGEEILELSVNLRVLKAAQERVWLQADARSGALPLFKAALEGKSLGRSLSVRRDHPAHVLLRRMQFENR